jgi:uncharacterized membrane protein (GlpM family)
MGQMTMTFGPSVDNTDMLSLIAKCLLGALAVLVIALLSKSKNFAIAGLVPLFPTFALIAHYMVGSERTGEDLRATALFGLWSLIPYALYLAMVYLMCDVLANSDPGQSNLFLGACRRCTFVAPPKVTGFIGETL